MKAETVLVTGAAGYLGAHTCVALLAAGHEVLGIDNFCNSTPAVLERVAAVAGRPLRFFQQGDVRDPATLNTLFAREPIDAVIHFAGLKSVGDSVLHPLDYYAANVAGSLALAQAMEGAGVHRLVFSSSATVYGDPESVPIAEGAALRPTNPYGRSKWMVEQIFEDLAASRPEWSIFLLRYFNPTGAHASGMLGEDPGGIPGNLMPFITQVAVGQRSRLTVFGYDYPTPDGTGVRDYLHVSDLVRGHEAALLASGQGAGCFAVNLGTGRGYSVLEIVAAFRKASDCAVPLVFAPRRPGDVATTYADVRHAHALLGWVPRHTLDDMCRDAWRWQQRNPQGYATFPPPEEVLRIAAGSAIAEAHGEPRTKFTLDEPT